MSGPVTRSQTRNAIPEQPHAIPEQPHQAQPVMPRAVTRSQTRNAVPEQSHQAHPGVTTDRIKEVPAPDITDFMLRRTSAEQKNMVAVMNMLLKKVKPTHVVKWASGQCTLEVRVRARKQRQARNPQESEVQLQDPRDPQFNSGTNRQEPVEGAGGPQQPESRHPEQPPPERQEVNSENIRREPLQVAGGLQQPELPHPDPPLTERPPIVLDCEDDDYDNDRAYPCHFVLGESLGQGANAVARPGAGIIPGLPVQEANAAVNAGNEVEVELVPHPDPPLTKPPPGGPQQPESPHPEQPLLERQEVNSENIRREPLQVVGGLQQPELPHPDPPLTERPPIVLDCEDDDYDDDDDRAYPSRFVLGESLGQGANAVARPGAGIIPGLPVQEANAAVNAGNEVEVELVPHPDPPLTEPPPGGSQQPESPHPEQPLLERQEVNSENIRREPLQVAGGLLSSSCTSHFFLGESSGQGANAVARPGAGIVPGLPVQEANAAVNTGNEVEEELVKSVKMLKKQLKSRRVLIYEGSLNSDIAMTEMIWVLLKELPVTVSRVKVETLRKSYENRMVRNWFLSPEKIPNGEEILTDITVADMFDQWKLSSEQRGDTKFVYFDNKEARVQAAHSDLAIMGKIITDLREASKTLKQHRSASKQTKE